MTSAQLEIEPLPAPSAEPDAHEAHFVLREQVAERVAAHRARRTRAASASSVTPIAAPTPAKARAQRIAAAVAERYEHSQSYRAFLAAEAERAIREAEAAAEVAALSARAVAEAQNQLLFELNQSLDQPQADAPAPSAVAPQPKVEAPEPHASLTIRLDEAFERSRSPLAAAHPVYTQPALDEDEAYALDEEIAFRQSPVFDDPPTDIPANLLEFPRQLVASRKARPRLAEGPLREEADHTPDAAQLRIFEVEASQISSAPTVESVVPEWSSIVLAAQPAAAPFEATEAAPFAVPHVPQTAPLGLRAMSAIVDSCVVLAAEFAFIALSAFVIQKLGQPATHLSTQAAAIGAAGVFVLFTLLYQTLFFTFSESTLGMRYARIAFCTFADDNPTRSAMRRRIFASILAACPLGLGYLWACLDEDALGWHDRISRMYQRSY